MPLSITVDNLKSNFSADDLFIEVQKRVQQYTPFEQEARCWLRDDLKVGISLSDVQDLFEIELDDVNVIHFYCTFKGSQNLQLCLGLMNYFRDKFGGEYSEQEVRHLRKLL